MRIKLLLLCAGLALPFSATHALGQVQSGNNTAARQWKPGTRDVLIAMTTADMLEQSHYLHLPLDAKVSDKFLTTYLNTLDPQHLHFLQSDLAEFERYRTNLGNLTTHGDTTPAYVIFNRFMQRLGERTSFSDDLLKNGGPMEFTVDEEMPLSRKNAPYAKDLTEAKKLWLQRLRYEYLLEKLSHEGHVEFANQVAGRHNPLSLALTLHDMNSNIVDVITHRYNRTIRTFNDWDDDKVLEEYLTALGHVYDPHTDYYNRADLENFSIQMSGTLFGIGATLTLSDDGYTTITDLIPSGPAFKSKKLKVNDRIVAVAQGDGEPVDVRDMPLVHVVDKIRGQKGTEVRLKIIPADSVDLAATKIIPLVREEINLEDQQAKGQIIEMPGPDGKPVRLGLVDLPSFYASFLSVGSRDRPENIKSPTLDVGRLLVKFEQEGVTGVILDLRHNGGGSLEEAINLTGLFIPQGPVVQVHGSDGSNDIKRDREPSMLYDGPLIVLTSRLSASASEIVAGALQDYDRAIIVGDRSTHGKGSVQSMGTLAQYVYLKYHTPVEEASALGALKYTTNKFYRVNGSSTQLKGVEADIPLPSTYEFMEVLGETSLENALRWDTISAVDYDRLNCVQPFLPELKKRSAARVATDKDYSYVREDIEQVKKAMSDKTISLNERTRLKEADENEARQKGRDAELKARKWPDEKIYELTLKQAELPGLPTPLVISNGVVVTNAVSLNPSKNSDTSPSTASTDDTASLAPKLPPAPVEASPEERAPLVEAEHILIDYISVWNRETALAKHAIN